MHISEATARTMGLKVVHGTRYKITREKVPVKSKAEAEVPDCDSQDTVPGYAA